MPKICSQCNIVLNEQNIYHTRLLCKNCYRLYKKEYNRNPKNKALKNLSARKALMINRISIIKHYSHGKFECSRCKIRDFRVLDLDHLNGGGSKERKNSDPSKFYRKLTKDGLPSGFQVLCRNCNWLKHVTALQNKTIQRYRKLMFQSS